MTNQLARYFLACTAAGALLGLLVGVMARSVVPAGGSLPGAAFSAAGVLLVVPWVWFCWWWLMVRT